MTGRPARNRPAAPATRGPAGPLPGPVGVAEPGRHGPAPGTAPTGVLPPVTGRRNAPPIAPAAPAPRTHGSAAPPPADGAVITARTTPAAPAYVIPAPPPPRAVPASGAAPSGSLRPCAAGARAGRGDGDAHRLGAAREPAAARDVPDRLAVDVLLRTRPRLAAAGLGLGVAVVSEPHLTPAGPAEATAAASMPPRRRQEFLAGRHAARRALRAVGLDCGEIPRSGRLPVFPPGRAASLSHSAGIAVAVAGAPGRDAPLGCDLELRPLPPGAARLVLREDEEGLLYDAGAWSVTALFSAKEAAWKALRGPDGTGAPGASGSLRDLRARPSGEGLRIELRARPARAVRVRVVPVGWGVFSYVVGRSVA